MSDQEVKVIDRTGKELATETFGKIHPTRSWAPVTVTGRQMEEIVSSLAAHPKPANGRREAVLAHPAALAGLGLGLTPGTQVVLSVLKPGESTAPVRQNSTQVQFCIGGGGHALIGGKRIDFRQYDVWNVPSFVPYRHFNDTNALQLRLTYSNAPLLEMLRVHVVDESPPANAAVHGAAESPQNPATRSPFGSFQLTEDGAWLMPYELLINPPVVESPALHWPWQRVRENLDKLAALGKDYIGRRLYLLYNPTTGRSNGTTPSFFATMTIRPPHIIDRPHRHVSAAINYYFGGKGYSIVEGERYEWTAGDLMLSAPGWAVHNHASYDAPVYELTVQDQPLHIMMESLLWQESLKEPPVVLGVNAGFSTNRAA